MKETAYMPEIKVGPKKKTAKLLTNIWPDGWATIRKALAEENWEDLRKCKDTVKYVEASGPNGRKFWKNHCLELGIPPEHYKDSLIGNPVFPVLYEHEGEKVTANAFRYAYSIHNISEHLTTKKNLSVLEVGAGYGGFAELFCRQHDVANYYFLDLPLMLTVQGYYMIKAGKADILRFGIPKEKVDLIVTINALGEMPPGDIANYIKIFEQVLKPETGLLYSVESKVIGRPKHVLLSWKDYPFDDKWIFDTRQFVRTHQVECFGRRTK